MSPHSATQDALSHLIGDKYDVLRWIGGGGMADVFLARHRQHGGLVAVKVLASNLAGEPRIVARFIQEARTAATLSGHPNIVTIFDVGDSNGIYYIIMQYIAGEDLGRYLAREVRIPPRDAIHVITQVADALVAAAHKGIVHRDLKPGNIRLDAYGRVIVLDFGIAKAGDQPSALTTADERLGTPYYMCPEQIRGEPCDQRSDLYTLGVIFHELLTGLRPFDGESYRAIEQAHLTYVPTAPAEIDPSIDPECSRMVMRLIQKAPDDRYQTAAALLADLRGLSTRIGAGAVRPVEDQEVEDYPGPPSSVVQTASADRLTPVTPPTLGERETKRKASWPIYAGSLAILIAMIGAGVYASRKPPAPQPVPASTVAQPAVQLPRTQSTDTGLMLLVPAGEFIFGDDSPESPNRKQTMTLPAFYIDATEVSNGTYKKFCDSASHRRPRSEQFLSKPDYPVTGVDAGDAEAFAVWAGKRIPTEQEWEKAARGHDGRIYPWGNQPPMPAVLAIQPVDAFPERQSPFGALNMAGNVWEWTITNFPASSREIDDMKRVLGNATFSDKWSSIKGGSFTPRQEIFFRSFMRRGWPRDLTSPFIGFRCVKDAKSN